MNKTLKIIANIIFIVLIAIIVLYFGLRVSGKAQIYKVQTGSMEKAIRAGDYILIYKKNKYNVDDVVTYKKGKYFITHRIIKINGSKVITKGDSNNTEDEEINKKDIVGTVIYYGGILNILLDYKYIFVSLLLGLYLLSCYFNKSDLKKE